MDAGRPRPNLQLSLPKRVTQASFGPFGSVVTGMIRCIAKFSPASKAITGIVAVGRKPSGDSRRSANRTACAVPLQIVTLLLLSISTVPVFVFVYLSLAWATFANASQIQTLNSYSAPDRSWRLTSTDCLARPDDFRTSVSQDLTLGVPVTVVDLNCGQGSEVLFVQPIEAAWPISEFDVQLDLNPDRPGTRMKLRLVLPSIHGPDGDGGLAVWLDGPEATHLRRWNRIRLSENDVDLKTLIKRQIWFLRSRYGPDVTDRGAYIDAVGVQLYSGPGKYSIAIGEPEISGSIAARPEVAPTIARHHLVNDPAVRKASGELSQESGPSLARRNGTVLELAGQPFFPRIIQYNGEPFPMLKGLGFNTIQLNSAANDQQLAAAAESGMWLICPPPPSLGILPMDSRYDRVIAWSLGNDRRSADFPLGQKLVDQIRQSDFRSGRPVMADVESGFAAWGNLSDAMIVGASPCVTGFGPGKYGQWVNQARLASGDRIPVWADVPSAYPTELIRQVMNIAGRVPPMPLSPQYMELMAFQSIAGGARGLRFLSLTRLDANDPQTRLRANTLAWLNFRLDVVEAWASGGIILGSASPDPTTNVSALKHSRGQLLIVSRTSADPYQVPGDPDVRTIRIPDRWSGVSDQAWQFTDEGLVPLSGQYHASGTEIQIDQAPWLSLVVVTQDPQLVDGINQRFRQTTSRQPAELRNDLTQQWLAIFQLVNEQMIGLGRGLPDVSGAIGDAITQVQSAENHIRSAAPSLAGLPLDQANQRLAWAASRMNRSARQPFAIHTDSPLLIHPAVLPMHWQLATQLAGKSWEPNALAGGDFENLQHMVDTGWENLRADDPNLQTRVELSGSARVQGTYCLLLGASHTSPHPGLAENPPLRISSAPAFVRGNKLVWIHGWIRVPRPIEGSEHGVRVFDSLGGPELGVCCQQNDQWQEFSMFRSSGQDTEMRVHIVMDGYGTAMLDELTIQTMELPAPEIRSAAQSSSNRQQ